MFTKLPKITEKNITVVKKLAKVFQICKNDVMFLLIFKNLQTNVLFYFF